jgi:hypothetical protein
MAYGSVLTDTVQTSTAATAPVFKDGNGTQIGTLCRAWVNFNGTGTVAIRASFNVSSITDNGTGDYTVNFTTAMPDANYSVVASSSYTANGVRGGVWAEPYAVSTSAARVLTSTSSQLYDCASVTASVFR